MKRSGWSFAGLTRKPAPAGASTRRGPELTPAGSIALVTGDDHIRQSILILLATRPGERVMRPDYGCPINRLVFNPNDATTAGLAIHYVRQALIRFEPRIDILHLDAGSKNNVAQDADRDSSTLFIWLDYRVRATQRAERLSFQVDLAGGQP